MRHTTEKPSEARLAKYAEQMLDMLQAMSDNPLAKITEARALIAQVTAPPAQVKVRIRHDDSPMNPGEWDNLGEIVHWHNRYGLRDGAKRVRNQDEAEEVVAEALFKLPIYMYDHSGVTVSTSPFGCRWDSGQVGWTYVTAESAKKIGCAPEYFESSLKAEIETLDQYCRGDVYGFEVIDEDGDVTDSCWGFYGHDWANNGIKEHLPDHLQDHTKWELP
ncbi:MAG: hypothetical protein WC869_01050 [Phycisphaerae bacterium]|jgi:hypothetical protein